MAKRWTVNCVVCDKKESFADSHDIRQAKWKVLAWIVPSGEPRCVCETCVYHPIVQPSKKKK